MPSDLSRALLDRLEEREYELLNWGVVDGAFTLAELREEASGVLAQGGDESPDELIESLLDKNWLFELPTGHGRYRTRFAEGVRLFSKLRQIFRPDGWDSAASLVGDFHVEIAPRATVRRDHSPEDLVERLRRSPRGLEPVEEVRLRALLAQTSALGGFQARATEALREGLGSDRDSGLIVCAGTGTGKSLAFYLPALVQIAGLVQKDRCWTKCLALYPRNVLLADQYASAYRMARRLDGELPRKATIGAFYGSAPKRAEELAQLGTRLDGAAADRRAGMKKAAYVSWDRVARTGWEFPTMRCPGCDGPLVWLDADLAAGRERLVCRGTCGRVVGGDEVVLTRRRMVEEPPDLLFTTTEMLNMNMAWSSTRRLFGIEALPAERPRMMLLDEAHTYSGNSGALAGLVVRRWRHALRGAPVQFVGLSATLADPEGFFAELVGLRPDQVRTARAEPDEIELGGREYRLVLRSDPVSGAGVLSTSIQASMLLARILNPMGGNGGDSAFPPKLFAFTDDLDVNNRFYDDLLDAEGRQRRFLAGWKQPLASHRWSGYPDAVARFDAGQNWGLVERVGNPLAPDPKGAPPSARRNVFEIHRTSSQDPGVNANDKVVVATASLEVGYDDDAVGGVLQHKAPLDSAAFLQRKGRAGRRYDARPWTVVVLSNAGRDRVAFSLREHLFNPELTRPSLPVHNRYVLKMQAVAAAIDWLYLQIAHLPNLGRVNAWMSMTSAPLPGDWFDKNRREQEALADAIESTLTDPERRRKLTEHVAGALKIGPDEALAVLWEPPRAVLAAALPTALRRLRSGWRRLGSDAPNADLHSGKQPLPDFLPENLFTDLNLPEVRLCVEDDERFERMDIALKETCVGRVTRRYSAERSDTGHWVPPMNLDDRYQNFPLGRLAAGPLEEIDLIPVRDGEPVRLVRLTEAKMERSPEDVLYSSNAFARWHAQFVPQGPGEALEVPMSGGLRGLLSGVQAFTHAGGAPVSVRRMSLGSEARVLRKEGKVTVAQAIDLRYVDGEGRPAAIGFEQDLDALRFTATVGEEAVDAALGSQALRALRPRRFVRLLQGDPTLSPVLDRLEAHPLDLAVLGEAFVGMALARAVRKESNVEAALDWLANRRDQWRRIGDHVMRPLFGLGSSPDGDSEDDEEAGKEAADGYVGPKRYRLLTKLIDDPEIQEGLLRHSAVLFKPASGAAWRAFAREEIRDALAGALLFACVRTVPETTRADLVVDIDPVGETAELMSEGVSEIWISETMLGGGGVIEQFLQSYARDPGAFALLVEGAVETSDMERAEASLSATVDLAVRDDEVRQVVGLVRESSNFAEQSKRQEALRALLRSRGLATNHAFFVSLNARVLRPGSSPAWDELLDVTVRNWREWEARLGLEVDARIVALIQGERAKEAFQSFLADRGIPVNEVQRVLMASLWPRGSALRRNLVEIYNRHAPRRDPEPAVLRAVLARQGAVDVTAEGWRELAREELRTGGSVRLAASFAQSAALQAAILDMLVEPTDSGFLRIFPHVARTEIDGQGVVATLRVREAGS